MEIQLLRNECEKEQTQIFGKLMTTPDNPRLAQYMLIGSGSRFFETDRSVAWL